MLACALGQATCALHSPIGSIVKVDTIIASALLINIINVSISTLAEALHTCSTLRQLHVCVTGSTSHATRHASPDARVEDSRRLIRRTNLNLGESHEMYEPQKCPAHARARWQSQTSCILHTVQTRIHFASCSDEEILNLADKITARMRNTQSIRAQMINHLHVISAPVPAKRTHVVRFRQRILATANDLLICFFALSRERFGELLRNANTEGVRASSM
jgi:hypothetical protein